MALELFYSALHWSKKAERFATSAINSARTAQTAAAQASQASGKIVQLGFDGTLEDGVLTFKHAPSGIEVPYELLDDYEYEIDMVYQGSDLADNVELVVKNGFDTINFVSALHRDSTTPATVNEMKSVMRFNDATGYRWLFKAAFKITPNGTKVFLLYPVVTAKNYGDKTNCITEIPQDIKLELNDGTLTLKAGSKVYVPNGFEEDGTTPKFDEVTVQNDIIPPSQLDNITDTWFLFYNNGGYNWELIRNCYSGENLPVGSSDNRVGYNTIANKMMRSESGGAYTELVNHSFPLCRFSTVNGTITSIDQVFNGFGYIGSTVFALPGVKGLIPNGRNADGSLKNIEVVTSKVAVRSDISPNVSGFFALNGIVDGFIDWGTNYELTDDNYLNTSYGNKVSNVVSGLFVTDSSGKITSFTPKQTFQAVDRNDSSWLSGLSMPSSRCIYLTLGASGSTYTAPANGWFCFAYRTNEAGGDIVLQCNNMRVNCRATTTGSLASVYMPCKKGDNVTALYSSTYSDQSSNYLRFIYAEGEN